MNPEDLDHPDHPDHDKPTVEPHPCPYACEIENDHEFRCTCSPKAEARCAEEI